MAVDKEVSRQHIREEMAMAEDVAKTCDWDAAVDYEKLTVTVKMTAHNGDRYVVEMLCDDYKEIPPFIEFIHPDTQARGVPQAYPRGKDSFFQASGPCICAPFSRKAYKSVCPEAPHADWNFGNWQTSTVNGVSWVDYSKLGDMLGLIYARISRADRYAGRMG
jgi:hypothetical protein